MKGASIAASSAIDSTWHVPRIICLPLWLASRWRWEKESHKKKWGQADYRTHPAPDKPDRTAQHVSQPVRSSFDWRQPARRPRLGSALWENKCEITGLPPSVIMAASGGAAGGRQERTLGVKLLLRFCVRREGRPRALTNSSWW